MEQPPAPGKSQKTPELTVNERSVDNSDYEKQVQKDFYKKSRNNCYLCVSYYVKF